LENNLKYNTPRWLNSHDGEGVKILLTSMQDYLDLTKADRVESSTRYRIHNKHVKKAKYWAVRITTDVAAPCEDEEPM
jgi:hypothetical protein